MQFRNELDFALEADLSDPLRDFRKRFHLPKKNGEPLIYFCGNSLGLQPKSVDHHIQQELKDWQELAVHGHMHGKNPWLYYHHFFEGESNIVGAYPDEVVLMNALSVNLHLMLTTFYQPQGNKFKILMEAGAFPSDQYAVESHLKMHSYGFEEGVIELVPREGEYHLNTEDILYTIENHKDELALILIGGVNYYTGQFFDLEAITQAGHENNIMVGFDLAHAAGNVPLKLHDWEVDFAAWCTYKYLNSGPGSVGGVFVHEKHGKNLDLPRLAGWWGNNEKTRFEMKKGFIPQPGAAGWQISNAPVFPMAIHKASLEIFNEAGMKNLNEKSEQLTGFLEWVIVDAIKSTGADLKIITPPSRKERGCQLSILTGENGKTIFEKLQKDGVITDWREPNVIRIAPVPLYNTFEEVYHFGQLLKSACEKS